VLQSNGWEHLAQEVLISTPRRFGKTISVSMFAAAMMWAAPSVEISIYSTCKRISQKLLRNCIKFFYEICKQDLAAAGFKVLRQNMEEIVLRGPGGERDQRVVNSYPSKVSGARMPKVCCGAARRAGGGRPPAALCHAEDEQKRQVQFGHDLRRVRVRALHARFARPFVVLRRETERALDHDVHEEAEGQAAGEQRREQRQVAVGVLDVHDGAGGDEGRRCCHDACLEHCRGPGACIYGTLARRRHCVGRRE